MQEVGRRKVTQTLFCSPDPTGEIVVSEGRFTVSQVPTNYLYLRFAFDFLDAQDATIRELGVFIGTQAKSTTPAGQDYLLPEDIEDPAHCWCSNTLRSWSVARRSAISLSLWYSSSY